MGETPRRGGETKEREGGVKVADQIKDEGAQLADSGQSTRTPTTE